MQRYLLAIILFVSLGWILSLPLVVHAQNLSSQTGWNPCWLEDDCKSKDGIWGKSIEKDPKQENLQGCLVDGGKIINGKCISLSSNSKDCKPIANKETAKCYNRPPNIKLQVPIPGLPQEFSGGFPVYLAAFYKFFVAAVAVMAVVMIMWGGFKRIYAVGSSERIADANDTIISAVIGLVLALVSYSLLQLINPRLVDLSKLVIEKIKTENYGNWCAKELRDKTGQPIECSVIYKDDYGYQCIGQVCTGTEKNTLFGHDAKICFNVTGVDPAKLGQPCYQDSNCGASASGSCKWEVPSYQKGCYRNQATGQLAGGKHQDYSCNIAPQACEFIDVSNVEKIGGVADEQWLGGDMKVFASACRAYNDNQGRCTWISRGTGSTGDSTSSCHYFSNNFIKSYCLNLDKPYNPDQPCSYYFNTFTIADLNKDISRGSTSTDADKQKQADWAACHEDWCNLGCKVDYVSGWKYWACKQK